MSTFGELLKSAREKSGLSVHDAAERTKIRKSYIEQLEGDSVEGLPQEVYVRGFIRNLSRLYGLDEKEMLEYFRKSMNPGGEDEKKKVAKKLEMELMDKDKAHGSVKKTRARKSSRSVAAILLLFILASAVYFGATWLGSAEEPSEEFLPADEPPVEESSTSPEEEPTAQIPESEEKSVYDEHEYRYISPRYIEEGVDIMVMISDDANSRCWVSFTVDGVEEYAETLMAGDVVRVFANNVIKLTLGDSGVASIYRDGMDTGFVGEPGVVVYKDFTKE